MANPNSPFGFRYFGRLEGGSPTEGLTPRIIASTTASAIFIQDPIVSSSTGYINIATANTSQINGILGNVRYLNSAVGRIVYAPYYPGSNSGVASDAPAGIVNDPDALFMVQTLNTAVTFADIGQNIGFATGTGNTTSGLSGFTVDQATLATTNTYPFKVVGLYSQYAPPGTAGTDDTSPFNIVIVGFNNVDRASGTTGV